MPTKIQLEVEVVVSKVIENPADIEKEFLKDVFGTTPVVSLGISGRTSEGIKIKTPDTEFWFESEIVISNASVQVVKYKERGGEWKSDKSLDELLDTRKYSVVPDVESDDCPVCGRPMKKGEEHHGICKRCFVNKYFHIHNYSHKPTPEFKKLDGEETKKFFGLEIEVSVDDRMTWAEFQYERPELYYKSDASIPSGREGSAEIVSHPISFKALMHKDSFINNMPEATNGSGCHIHVSREAFDSDTHFSLWYFLMLKSNKLLNTVSRREENHYCKRTAYEDISTKKNKKKSGLDRVAINERNDHTVEVRIFQWSTDPKILRSYVQFIDSMIEYTRNKKRTATVTAWKKYVSGLEKYADIYEVVKDITFPKGSGVSRVTPRYTTIKVNSLTMRHLNKGALFQYDGQECKVLTIDCSRGDDTRLYLEGYGDVRVSPTDEIKVRVN